MKNMWIRLLARHLSLQLILTNNYLLFALSFETNLSVFHNARRGHIDEYNREMKRRLSKMIRNVAFTLRFNFFFSTIENIFEKLTNKHSSSNRNYFSSVFFACISCRFHAGIAWSLRFSASLATCSSSSFFAFSAAFLANIWRFQGGIGFPVESVSGTCKNNHLRTARIPAGSPARVSSALHEAAISVYLRLSYKQALRRDEARRG